MFKKILIANRGEIACRVIKTAQRLGVATVAVYSDADRQALHVKLADEAVHLGASPASESYLRADKLIQAAKRVGAEAIHPGYGFLSENSEFCAQCREAGIVFIGPSAEAIAAMGSKSSAKNIMAAAGVPLVPGYHGDEQSPQALKAIADDMGYPVLLKAAAGGGGRGMRPVAKSEEFLSALKDAKRESLSSFGDDHMLVEKYLFKPRHVEVQVFCDNHGNAVYLFDRDCSIQRRHQKVIEEAPAPGLSDALRKAMGEAAVKAALAINYVGAGTIEFLLDTHEENRDAFYFMEMNTRLQVEHPVTELITNTDLVAWQLQVASGEALPLLQDDIVICGHAMEARIYAEDPEQNYCPSSGTLHYFTKPESSEFVRIDSGVVQGDVISTYYDSMISKLITWDKDRDSCRARMIKALDECAVVGVSTNIKLLKNIFAHQAFADGKVNTHFLDEHEKRLHQHPILDLGFTRALACLYVLESRRRALTVDGAHRDSPWQNLGAWRMNQGMRHRLLFSGKDGTEACTVDEKFDEPRYGLHVNGEILAFSGKLDGIYLDAEVAGCRVKVTCIARAEGEFSLIVHAQVLAFTLVKNVFDSQGQSSGAGGDLAPMSGRILEILVGENDSVNKGDAVLVMEAMKMEHTVLASKSGRVSGILCRVDDVVEDGKQLIAIEALEQSAP